MSAFEVGADRLSAWFDRIQEYTRWTGLNMLQKYIAYLIFCYIFLPTKTREVGHVHAGAQHGGC